MGCRWKQTLARKREITILLRQIRIKTIVLQELQDLGCLIRG